MYEMQNVLKKMKTFEYMAIAGASVFVILVSFMIYNMVTVHNMNKDSEDKYKKQLLSIALNKNKLKMMKNYINEESSDLESSIRQNTNKLNSNKNTIQRNKSELENTITSMGKNKTDLEEINQRVVLNTTKNSSVESSFDTYKTNQSRILESITNKQNAIQSNIGEFSYTDYNVLTQLVNSNNIRINNLNTNVGTLMNDFSDVEEEVESIQDSYFKKANLADELGQYYDDIILPKFDDLDYLIKVNVNKYVGMRSDVDILEDVVGINSDTLYNMRSDVDRIDKSTGINRGNIYNNSNDIHFMLTPLVTQNQSDISQIGNTHIENQSNISQNKTLIDGISGDYVNQDILIDNLASFYSTKIEPKFQALNVTDSIGIVNEEM
jgi:hypothetical protein